MREIKPCKGVADQGDPDPGGADRFQERGVPELQCFNHGGYNEHCPSDFIWCCCRKKEEHHQGPEDHIEHPSQRVIYPSLQRPVIEFGQETQGDEYQ